MKPNLQPSENRVVIVAAAIVRFTQDTARICGTSYYIPYDSQYVEVAIDCYLFTQSEFGKLESDCICGI